MKVQESEIEKAQLNQNDQRKSERQRIKPAPRPVPVARPTPAASPGPYAGKKKKKKKKCCEKYKKGKRCKNCPFYFSLGSEPFPPFEH